MGRMDGAFRKPDNVVVVSPILGGWSVTTTFSGEPIYFRSGAHAESAARKLALMLAQCGQDAHVIVNDRRNAQIGTICYFGASADGATPP